MTNPIFPSIDPDTKRIRESHLPARLSDAALSTKIVAEVGGTIPDGAVTSTDFSVIKISHDPAEEALPGTVLFYFPPPTTLFTDFSTTAVGQIPDGWTPRWATARTWQVAEDPTATGGKSLQCDIAAGTSGLHWEAVSTLLAGGTDGELVWKWRTSNLSSPARAFMAGSGTTSTITALHGAMRNVNNVSLGKFVDGVHTVNIGNQVSVPDLEAEAWYISRMKRTGDTLHASTWKAGTPEPTDWQMEATDTTITGAGWWGLLSHLVSGSATHSYDWVGFAIGGHTAPMGAE